MRSFYILLISALALLLLACAPVIREQGAHHAIIAPANLRAGTVINDCSESARISMTAVGFVADSVTYGGEPLQLTFPRQFLAGAPSVNLTAQMYTGGKYLGSVTQSFTLNRQFVMTIKRVQSYYGASECIADLVFGDELDTSYGLLGGLIRVDAGVSTRSGATWGTGGSGRSRTGARW